MKRIIATLALSVGLLGAAPATAHAIPHDIDHCDWEVDAPRVMFGYLFTWTTVTCDRPTKVTIYTVIRRGQTGAVIDGKVVAANVKTEIGYSVSLLTRVLCRTSFVGLKGTYYSNTLISFQYLDALPIYGSGQTMPGRAPCLN